MKALAATMNIECDCEVVFTVVVPARERQVRCPSCGALSNVTIQVRKAA